MCKLDSKTCSEIKKGVIFLNRTSEYRRFREDVYQQKLKRLFTDSAFPLVWWNNYWNRKYLKQYYYGSPYHKKMSHKCARRIDFEQTKSKGNLYRKYYDYKWSIH